MTHPYLRPAGLPTVSGQYTSNLWLLRILGCCVSVIFWLAKSLSQPMEGFWGNRPTRVTAQPKFYYFTYSWITQFWPYRKINDIMPLKPTDSIDFANFSYIQVVVLQNAKVTDFWAVTPTPTPKPEAWIFPAMVLRFPRRKLSPWLWSTMAVQSHWPSTAYIFSIKMRTQGFQLCTAALLWMVSFRQSSALGIPTQTMAPYW